MTDKHIIIIAEAGVNHNGDIDMARRMVAEARKAGADYVKFQTAVPELVISTFAPKAEYQKATTGEAESQLEMCKAIHLPLSDYAELKALCDEAGIGFMSTPFDLVSVDCLVPLSMDYWKIPSGEITNLPYLLKIGRLGGRVIMSTGMATLNEVEAAVRVLESAGTPRGNIWLLHCTTQYPAPLQSVNLRAMDALASLGCAGVGYSDHTEGIEVEAALGDGVKEVADAERPNIEVARKSIVAARAIAEGELFSEDNITVKRPGSGISPMRWFDVLGSRAPRSFEADELISL